MNYATIGNELFVGHQYCNLFFAELVPQKKKQSECGV
jgi:hypothetical protein